MTVRYSQMAAAFPDYDQATLPEIPRNWIDASWCNDACPCFEVKGTVYVYVDYADRGMREFTVNEPRFNIFDFASGENVLATDDWAALLTVLDALGAAV